MSRQEVGIEDARKRLGDYVTAAQQGADIVLTRNGKPAARIVAIKEPAMTTTTTYASWANVDTMNLTVEQSVVEAFGAEGTDGFDVDEIVIDYRQAINDALPEGVSLNGDEFYGPYYDADRNFDGYPTDENGSLDLKSIVDGIDFWEIAARHDKNT